MANPKRISQLKFWTFKHRNQHTTLNDIEDMADKVYLIKMAREAAINAINENKAMNIPITVLEDGWIVRKKGDGSIEKIKEIYIKKATIKGRTLKKGEVLHVKSSR